MSDTLAGALPGGPEGQVRSTSLAREALARLIKSPLAILGATIVFVFAFTAIFAPWLATHDPALIVLANRLQPPSPQHWLGTDDLGRDVFSRLVYGARVSLMVGIGVVAIRALIGVLVGLVSGYAGGAVDALLMRITDVFIAFPGILLALAIMAIWGTGLINVVIALSVVGWPQFARLVRAEVLSLRERDYVQAGRALGGNAVRLVSRHVFPNVLPIIVVYTSLNISAPIIAEAALSFLGLGIQPPEVSWGSMLSSAHRYMRVAWWLATFPGIAITVSVIGFNLFGDAVRDALDPRMR